MLPLVATLGGCAAAPPLALAPSSSGPVRVMNGELPFGMADGALARKVAEEECKARGRSLRSSIYDRFDGGTWVFVEGCA